MKIYAITYNFCNIGYFSYKIIEIDVIEKSTNERERLKDPK